MVNKYEAVMDFINICPLVGADLYFNFIDETNNDRNTSLVTVPYPTPARKYTDGNDLLRLQFEIRQTKPLSKESNTTANTDQIGFVQEFLDWINKQGRKGKFPDFGESCEVQFLGTPRGITTPAIAGVSDGVMLYAFPFEIHYFENK